MIERYAEEPEDEEDEDVNQFARWGREPRNAIRSYILDFNHCHEIAPNTGQVDRNDKYKTKFFFDKGRFTEIEKYDILNEVGGDRSRFEEVQKHARTLMTLKEKSIKKTHACFVVPQVNDGDTYVADGATYFAPSAQPAPASPVLIIPSGQEFYPSSAYPLMSAYPQLTDCAGWVPPSQTVF